MTPSYYDVKEEKNISAQESSSKQYTNNLSTHFIFLENFMRLCIHKRRVVIPIYTVNWLYRFISMLSLHFVDICIKFNVFFNPPRAGRSRIDTLLLYILRIHYFKIELQRKMYIFLHNHYMYLLSLPHSHCVDQSKETFNKCPKSWTQISFSINKRLSDILGKSWHIIY